MAGPDVSKGRGRIGLVVLRGAERSVHGYWNARTRRFLRLGVWVEAAPKLDRISFETSWPAGQFAAVRFDVRRHPVVVESFEEREDGVSVTLVPRGGEPLRAVQERELGRLILTPCRSSIPRGERQPDPKLIHPIRLVHAVCDGEELEPKGELLVVNRQPKHEETLCLEARDQEILRYLQEMWFLTEQTIISLWFRVWRPAGEEGKREGARWKKRTGLWYCSAARRRLRRLRDAGYIRKANPRDTAKQVQHANWMQYWHARPYLLGREGRKHLIEAGLIPYYFPARKGSKALPAPSPNVISTHGSNNVHHEMGLVGIRFLLEKATLTVEPGVRGLDFDESRKLVTGWSSERSLYYQPEWPMFRKGKMGALNRPGGWRHPDAIISWRGGEDDLGGARRGRFAIEYECTTAGGSPKSVADYERLVDSYQSLIMENYLDWVILIFNDKTAAKRFRRRYLPEIARRRRIWTLYPQLFFTVWWPEWRDSLQRTIRTGRRSPLPMWFRTWDMLRREWRPEQTRDLWDVGDYATIGADPIKDALWTAPEGLYRWRRCWMANQAEVAAAVHEALDHGQMQTVLDMEDLAGVPERWSYQQHRWTDLKKPLAHKFPPGTPVYVKAEVPTHPGIYRVTILSEQRRNEWSGEGRDYWSPVIKGYVHGDYLRLRPGWQDANKARKDAKKALSAWESERRGREQEFEQQRRKYESLREIPGVGLLLKEPDEGRIYAGLGPRPVVPDLGPNAELTDPAYEDWQRNMRLATYPEVKGPMLPLYRDLATFKRAMGGEGEQETEEEAGNVIWLAPGTRVQRLSTEALSIKGKRHWIWRVLVNTPEGLSRWWVHRRDVASADIRGFWLARRDVEDEIGVPEDDVAS